MSIYEELLDLFNSTIKYLTQHNKFGLATSLEKLRKEIQEADTSATKDITTRLKDACKANKKMNTKDVLDRVIHDMSSKLQGISFYQTLILVVSQSFASIEALKKEYKTDQLSLTQLQNLSDFYNNHKQEIEENLQKSLRGRIEQSAFVYQLNQRNSSDILETPVEFESEEIAALEKKPSLKKEYTLLKKFIHYFSAYEKTSMGSSDVIFISDFLTTLNAKIHTELFSNNPEQESLKLIKENFPLLKQTLEAHISKLQDNNSPQILQLISIYQLAIQIIADKLTMEENEFAFPGAKPALQKEHDALKEFISQLTQNERSMRSAQGSDDFLKDLLGLQTQSSSLLNEGLKSNDSKVELPILEAIKGLFLTLKQKLENRLNFLNNSPNLKPILLIEAHQNTLNNLAIKANIIEQEKSSRANAVQQKELAKQRAAQRHAEEKAKRETMLSISREYRKSTIFSSIPVKTDSPVPSVTTAFEPTPLTVNLPTTVKLSINDAINKSIKAETLYKQDLGIMHSDRADRAQQCIVFLTTLLTKQITDEEKARKLAKFLKDRIDGTCFNPNKPLEGINQDITLAKTIESLLEKMRPLVHFEVTAVQAIQFQLNEYQLSTITKILNSLITWINIAIETLKSDENQNIRQKFAKHFSEVETTLSQVITELNQLASQESSLNKLTLTTTVNTLGNKAINALKKLSDTTKNHSLGTAFNKIAANKEAIDNLVVINQSVIKELSTLFLTLSAPLAHSGSNQISTNTLLQPDKPIINLPISQSNEYAPSAANSQFKKSQRPQTTEEVSRNKEVIVRNNRASLVLPTTTVTQKEDNIPLSSNHQPNRPLPTTPTSKQSLRPLPTPPAIEQSFRPLPTPPAIKQSFRPLPTPPENNQPVRQLAAPLSQNMTLEEFYARDFKPLPPLPVSRAASQANATSLSEFSAINNRGRGQSRVIRGNNNHSLPRQSSAQASTAEQSDVSAHPPAFGHVKRRSQE